MIIFSEGWNILIDNSSEYGKIIVNYFEKILKKYNSEIYSYVKNDNVKNEINFKINKKLGDTIKYSLIKNNLLFEGSDSVNLKYAIYDFLEKKLGVMYMTSVEEFIPDLVKIELDDFEYSYTPKLKYREVYYKEFIENKNDFSIKHKVVSDKDKEKYWGFWCHSFQKLLPKELFAEHPEYFALINGRRRENGEPCLGNKEVRKIMLENFKKEIEKNPTAKYWSISQNDDANYCRCEKCKKRDEIDGGPIGSILDFANEVATEYPDKIISTLAYWYSRKPPQKTKPNKNVNIMLCNIEVCHDEPIESSEKNIGSKKELETWSKISENIILWDYNIQFSNLISPFPNFRTLKENLNFYLKNNVTSIFRQGNRETGGEFSELRGYLLAKLCWDETLELEKLINDFCNNYYGKASKYIVEYINLLHDEMEKSKKNLSIFGTPMDARDSYLSRELLEKYFLIFENALYAVNLENDYYGRVEKAMLPLYYAAIRNRYGNASDRLKYLEKLVKIGEKFRLEKVEEWTITLKDFIYDEMLNN